MGALPILDIDRAKLIPREDHVACVARDRFLLRADVEGYSYKDLLEVRPGSVRLLHPSEASRRTVKIVTTLVVLGYLFVVNAAFFPFLTSLAFVAANQVDAVLLVVAFFIVMFGGMVAIALWWENRALPILADHPSRTLDLRVLDSRSFGTFQEVRAGSPEGELRITVQGSKQRLDDAFRLAAGPGAPT